MKVRGKIWFIFEVEFDLNDWSVRIVKEHWSWRRLGFLSILFTDKNGMILAPSVLIKSDDPTVNRDCLSILMGPDRDDINF